MMVAYIGAAIAFFVGGILQNRNHSRYSRKKKTIKESKNLNQPSQAFEKKRPRRKQFEACVWLPLLAIGSVNKLHNYKYLK